MVLFSLSSLNISLASLSFVSSELSGHNVIAMMAFLVTNSTPFSAYCCDCTLLENGYIGYGCSELILYAYEA
jgi:hypothetical protein